MGVTEAREVFRRIVLRSAEEEVFEVLNVDGRIILKCVKKYGMASVRTGFVWLRIVTGL